MGAPEKDPRTLPNSPCISEVQSAEETGKIHIAVFTLRLITRNIIIYPVFQLIIVDLGRVVQSWVKITQG